MKTLTKQEFQQLAFPVGNGKDAIPARMDLKPNNTGIINGNTYDIKVYEYEDKVELTLKG